MKGDLASMQYSNASNVLPLTVFQLPVLSPCTLLILLIILPCFSLLVASPLYHFKHTLDTSKLFPTHAAPYTEVTNMVPFRKPYNLFPLDMSQQKDTLTEVNFQHKSSEAFPLDPLSWHLFSLVQKYLHPLFSIFMFSS